MEGYTEVFAWGGDHFGQLGLGGKVLNKTYPSPRFCSFNITIKDISCGEEHSGFISSSGHVYTMGSNTDGRLGIGSRTIRQSASPCLVEDLINFNAIKISCGLAHTAILTDTGEVFAWGLGEFGALGNGSAESKYSPSHMSLPKSSAIDISCGSRHSGIVLKEKSSKKVLFMCGGGEAGQLGTGRREKELVPVMVELVEEIEQVSCGVFHTGIVTTRGNVYTMGGNSFGQLGLGNKKSQNRPEKVTHLENVFIKRIRCSNFTAAVSDKGFLYVWGSGIFGEFLLPNRWNIRESIVDVAVGAGFGVAIDFCGGVYVWGGNSNGELGVDDYEARVIPTLVTSLKGKNLKKLACGGNFCIGLGSDVQPRMKTPERKRKIEEDVNRTRIEEVEKSSMDLKQTYKCYEDLKRNFETLTDKYEQEKKSNSKYTEELTKEILRYKQELDRHRAKIELDDREIREISACVIELKRTNHELSLESNSYKQELLLQKKHLEESRMINRTELKKIDDLRDNEILTLQEKYNQEIGRRKQMERELEKADLMMKNYENNMKNCQQDLNELSLQFEENSQQGELERKRLQNQIEKYSKELGDSLRKNENLLSEKEKFQSLMKVELERCFRENKELRYEAEVLKQQIQEKTEENLRLVKELRALSSDKEAVENQVSEQIERLSQEKQKKIESLYVETDKLRAENSELLKNVKVMSNERKILEGEFSEQIEKVKQEKEKRIETVLMENEKLKKENSELLKDIKVLERGKKDIEEQFSEQIERLTLDKQKKIEMLFLENDKIRDENSNLIKSLEHVNSELENFESITEELERLENENSQLGSRIKYLVQENENMSASLSSEIELLSTQKQDLSEKLDQLQTDKEKKIHSLTSQLEKNFIEYNQLKGSIDTICTENEKLKSKLTSITDEYKDLLQKHDQLLIEYKRSTAAAQESTKLSAELDNLTSKSETLMQNYDQICRDKEKKIYSLNNELENILIEFNQLKGRFEVICMENEKQSAKLTCLADENKGLRIQNDNLSMENRKIIAEVQDSNMESSKLLIKIENLTNENSDLRRQLNDLDSKNRQLFENLERELAQRAREYKERTMNILNMPRSNSPAVRPPTPDGRVRMQTPIMSVDKNYNEDIGNTAARLLTTLDASPRSKGSLRTPTKEDLKTKIANLMENRNRIENELRGMEDY